LRKVKQSGYVLDKIVGCHIIKKIVIEWYVFNGEICFDYFVFQIRLKIDPINNLCVERILWLVTAP